MLRQEVIAASLAHFAGFAEQRRSDVVKCRVCSLRLLFEQLLHNAAV